jgi:hypothetical protein
LIKDLKKYDLRRFFVIDNLVGYCVIKGEYKLAKERDSENLELINGHFGKNHIGEGIIALNEGFLDRYLASYISSLDNFEKSKKIMIDYFGEKSIEVAHVYNGLS